MKNTKKEFPIWFKVETILFLFFSGALTLSFLKMNSGLERFEEQFLMMKLVIVLSIILAIWLISLMVCCREK